MKPHHRELSRLVTVLNCTAGIVGLTVLVGCGPGGSHEGRPTRINLSLILGETSEWYAGAKRWKDLVEERSAGAFDVRIHTRASLSSGNQITELDMVGNGDLEVSLESTILLSRVDNKFSVFSLPWLFRDHQVANAVCDGPLGQQMLDLLPAKGMVGLAYGVNGFRQITNNKKPIEKVGDLKGLKIRVPGIDMYIGLFRHFGADPSSMNFGELLQALQQGTMDAQENPFSVIMAAKLHSVQEYVTHWDYSYDPLVLCVNKRFFGSLSPEHQGLLRSCAKEAMAYERQLVEKADAELPPKLVAAGMALNRLTPEQLAPFKAAQEPLYRECESNPAIGKELVDAFRKAAAEAEGR